MTDTTDPTAFPIAFDPREERMRGTTRLGNKYFDVPFISHVMDNLWQGGCERGLTLPEEIKHVISLYKWERYTVNHDLLSFTEVTAYDSDEGGTLGGMSIREVLELAGKVNKCRKEAPTLVHCQAGLNRSSLIAATALVLNGDVSSGAEAVALLRKQRSPAVLSNQAFESWLIRHFDTVDQ